MLRWSKRVTVKPKSNKSTDVWGTLQEANIHKTFPTGICTELLTMLVLIEQGTNKPIEVYGHLLFNAFGFMGNQVSRTPWRFVQYCVKSIYRLRLHLVNL